MASPAFAQRFCGLPCICPAFLWSPQRFCGLPSICPAFLWPRPAFLWPPQRLPSVSVASPAFAQWGGGRVWGGDPVNPPQCLVSTQLCSASSAFRLILSDLLLQQQHLRSPRRPRNARSPPKTWRPRNPRSTAMIRIHSLSTFGLFLCSSLCIPFQFQKKFTRKFDKTLICLVLLRVR